MVRRLPLLNSPKKTALHERYVREWLAGQAASGYIDYHFEKNTFSLSPEQAMAFAEERSPHFALVHSISYRPRIWTNPRSPRRFEVAKASAGTTIRSAYSRARSASSDPAIAQISFQLDSSAGRCRRETQSRRQCGRCGMRPWCFHHCDGAGLSEFKVLCIRLSHALAERAKTLAITAGVEDEITFAQAMAKDFPANDYDLVAFFDCLHDMGDPVGAGKHVKETLASDGVWMIVEPFAHDDLKDNLNPIGRVYYGTSIHLHACLPLTGSGAGPWRSGGRAPVTSSRRRGGFQALSPCY